MEKGVRRGEGREKEEGERKREEEERTEMYTVNLVTHLFIPGRFPQKYLALLAAEMFLASTTTGLH